MDTNILFVDDDPNILSAYRRTLHNKYNFVTASGGEEGLEKLMLNNSISVVVADMRMPGMDGITFLQKVRKYNKDIVRIMLTGNADINSAIDAVNDGRVFRFLTKPCPPITLINTLNDALKQFQLITAEQTLLKKTLTGSVKVLVEILGMVNPAAFSKSIRLKNIVCHIATQMNYHNTWLYEVAAMLSQIGCVSLPPALLNKTYSQVKLDNEEKRMYQTHPILGSTLLSKIPRLEPIAKIIKNQNLPVSQLSEAKDLTDVEIKGSKILKASIDFDQEIIYGRDKKTIIEEMKLSPNIYDYEIVSKLISYKSLKDSGQTKIVYIKDLIFGMIAAHDIKANNGILLVGKGQEINYPVIAKLQNFSKHLGIEEPFEILLPLKHDTH